MLPIMSFLTGVKAIEPRTSGAIQQVILLHDIKSMYTPKRVVSDSEASKKSVVGIALSLLASMGTSTKDFFSVSNQVPPAGYEKFDGTAIMPGEVSRL